MAVGLGYSLDLCQEKTDRFYEMVHQAMHVHFPTKVIRVFDSDKPWFNDRLRKLVLNRQKALNNGDRVTFNCLRNKVIRQIKSA